MGRQRHEFHHLGSPRVLQISASPGPSDSFFSSIRRLPCLERYGFTKVESEQHFEYANDYFVRGKPERSLDIQRRYMATLVPPNTAYKPFLIEPAAALEAMRKRYMEFLPPGTFDFKPSLRDPVALRAHLMDAVKQGRAMLKDPLSLREKELAATLLADVKVVINQRKAFLMEALAAGPSSSNNTHSFIMHHHSASFIL